MSEPIHIARACNVVEGWMEYWCDTGDTDHAVAEILPNDTRPLGWVFKSPDATCEECLKRHKAHHAHGGNRE